MVGGAQRSRVDQDETESKTADGDGEEEEQSDVWRNRAKKERMKREKVLCFVPSPNQQSQSLTFPRFL